MAQVSSRLAALEQGQGAPLQISKQLSSAVSGIEKTQQRLEHQLTEQAAKLTTLVETMTRANASS